MAINDVLISEQQFVECFKRVTEAADAMGTTLTYFEVRSIAS